MISQQDIPSDSRREITSNSPYNTVSRFTASKSTPSLASTLQDDTLTRTESLPSQSTPSQPSSPTKPSMPWMMPSSTRGAGSFVASAALKRSSTVIRGPASDTSDIRARPATMYARTGHQRNFGGSITSTGSLSPRKHQFQEPTQEDKPNNKPIKEPSPPPNEPSPEPSPEPEQQIPPTPPPHKTPPLSTLEFKSPPPQTTSPPITSSPTSSPPIPSPSPPEKSPTTPPQQRLPNSTSTDSLSRKRWSPTKSSW